MRDIFNTVKIGERIKARREALGMTPAELAYKCGYKSTQSVVILENGNCKGSKRVYEKVSKGLDIPYEELVDGYTTLNPFCRSNIVNSADAKRVVYYDILDKYLQALDLDPSAFEAYLVSHCHGAV